MSDICSLEVGLAAAQLCWFGGELERALDRGAGADSKSSMAALLTQLASDGAEHGLSLCFEADDALLTFAQGDNDNAVLADGRVAVGYFWLSCKLLEPATAGATGNKQAQVIFTAATASISRLMKESASVQRSFQRLAKAAQAHSLNLRDEWGDLQHYPLHEPVRAAP